MEEFDWFLFLLLREAAGGEPCFGWESGLNKIKRPFCFEDGWSLWMAFWPLTVEGRPYPSIWGRRMHRRETAVEP